MAKLNSSLLNSLLIDIREFNNFVNEMNSLIGGYNNHLSWKYPHKLSKNINVMEIIKKRKGTAGEMYISLLEIAYDRMHFVLELIVDFLSAKGASPAMKKGKQSKGKFTSPSGTINKLLIHFKSQPSRVNFEDRAGDGMDFGVVGAVTRGTQANSCLGCCENCSVVCLCLVELIRRTENTFKDDKFISHVVQAREYVQTRLVEATQWEVVTKLSQALTNDVDGIMRMWRAVRDENEGLEKEKRSLSWNLVRAQRDLEVRDFELDEMRMRGDEMRREAIALGKNELHNHEQHKQHNAYVFVLGCHEQLILPGAAEHLEYKKLLEDNDGLFFWLNTNYSPMANPPSKFPPDYLQLNDDCD